MRKVIMFCAGVVAALCVYTLNESKTREMQLIEENAKALAIVPVEVTCYKVIAEMPGCKVLYCPRCIWLDESMPVTIESADHCVPSEN